MRNVYICVAILCFFFFMLFLPLMVYELFPYTAPVPTSPEEEPPMLSEQPTEPPVEEDTQSAPSEPNYPLEVIWHSDLRVYPIGKETTEVYGEKIDRDFLAKLLYAEAGGESWWGQVYTCSAILNHCEVSKLTLWEAGHNINHFAVAPYIDNVKPSQRCYEVVDYVLNGGRIAEICFFRSGHYHNFGTPVCQVDGHYFSMN